MLCIFPPKKPSGSRLLSPLQWQQVAVLLGLFTTWIIYVWIWRRGQKKMIFLLLVGG